MGKFEIEPTQDNWDDAEDCIKELLECTFETYEPWFPEKRIVLKDSLSLMAKNVESYNSFKLYRDSKDFHELRFKLLDLNLYYTTLLLFDLKEENAEIKRQSYLTGFLRSINIISLIILLIGVAMLLIARKMSKEDKIK